ncbi:MAG: glycosyltransferase [Sphaerochaetaceae bacterium]|nr:glycosyltransferase [Sphaerochaetaceae bacterium]
MEIAGIVFLVIGVYFFIVSVTNSISLRRIKGNPILTEGPLISVCIPARNEESNIANCVNSMMAQSYSNIEILVLDDNSTDATASIVLALAEKDPRIHYIKGKKLAAGWKGKTYAMQQMLEQAHGDYILFTDADTIHGKDSVANGYSIAVQNNAEFLSGYPHEKCPNYMGRTAISSMVLPIAVMPLSIQKKLQLPIFAMCIGQFMFVKRTVMLEVGGMESIKNGITDDVNLVRLIVKNKHRALFTSLKDHVTCLMYPDLSSAMKGIGRSIAGVLPTWMFSILFIALILVVLASLSGLASLILLIALGYSKGLLMVLIGSFLVWIAWFIAARFCGFNLAVSFSQPLAFILVAITYAYSVISRLLKHKILWKGREV